jgi:hypothetical protein
MNSTYLRNSSQTGPAEATVDKQSVVGMQTPGGPVAGDPRCAPNDEPNASRRLANFRIERHVRGGGGRLLASVGVSAGYPNRHRPACGKLAAMAEVVVGSIIGLAGAVIGAVVTHLLQRSHDRQSLELERAKVFSEQRLNAYVNFRRLAERARHEELNRTDRSDGASVQLRNELREASIVIDSIGASNVVIAARDLLAAFEAKDTRPPGSIPTRRQMQAVTNAVRNYVDAVRSSFEVDPLHWETF